MALSATIINFTLELADIDRNIYDTVEFRLAQHPSENTKRVVIRVLARALSHQEGLEFGRGLSNVEEPALWLKDPQGRVDLWIDVGAPSASRLHRASKEASKVLVVTDKNTTGLQKEWAGQRIHRAEEIPVVRIPPDLTASLAETLGKQNRWVITLTDGYLNIGIGDQSLDGQLETSPLSDFL